MISDYADLLVTSADYSGQQDASHMLPKFVGFAEVGLNRDIRTRQMVAGASVTTDAGGVVPLPADFLAMLSVADSAGDIIPGGEKTALDILYSRTRGASAYSISAGSLYVYPAGVSTLSLTYYAALAGLSAANPTNWLLSKNPMAYLYSVVAEILKWAIATGREPNADKLTVMEGLRAREIAQIMNDDRLSKFSNARITIGGVTP